MSRDRDAAGRPRNARPRDALGRPLPRAGVGDSAAPPDPAPLPPRDALREAQRLLDANQPFTAHEVLEGVWKSSAGSERALWRGLAQIAVGLTHRARANDVGARTLLARAATTLADISGAPWDVPVAALRRWAVVAADDPVAAGSMPRLVGQAADERA